MRKSAAGKGREGWRGRGCGCVARRGSRWGLKETEGPEAARGPAAGERPGGAWRLEAPLECSRSVEGLPVWPQGTEWTMAGPSSERGSGHTGIWGAPAAAEILVDAASEPWGFPRVGVGGGGGEHGGHQQVQPLLDQLGWSPYGAPPEAGSPRGSGPPAWVPVPSTGGPHLSPGRALPTEPCSSPLARQSSLGPAPGTWRGEMNTCGHVCVETST